MYVVRDTNGDVLALVDETHVWFAEQIEVLEKDHPRRRFTAMLALAAGVMQTGPEPEVYDPEAAADDLKREVPIWKRQVFADGDEEWVGTP